MMSLTLMKKMKTFSDLAENPTLGKTRDLSIYSGN